MGISRRRMLASLAALTAVGAGALGARSALARYYDGPVSDHFDGVHFFDPHGMPPKKLQRARPLVLGGWPRQMAGMGAEPACRPAAAARRRGYASHLVCRPRHHPHPDRRR